MLPELERLEAYRDHLARMGATEGGGVANLGRSAGLFLYNLAVLSIFGLLLFYYRRAVYRDFRHVLLLALLIGAFVGGAAIVSGSGWPAELIPIAFPALVVAALWDGRMALNLSLILAILLAGQTPFLGVSTLFTLVMGGAAASLGARVARRRSSTWAYIAIIAGAYVLAALALGLLRSRGGRDHGLRILGLRQRRRQRTHRRRVPAPVRVVHAHHDRTDAPRADRHEPPAAPAAAARAAGTFAHSLNVANLAEARRARSTPMRSSPVSARTSTTSGRW